jgi:hypothetical protein
MKFTKNPRKDGYYLYRPAKRPNATPVLVRIGHWKNNEFFFTFPYDVLNREPPRWAIGCVGGLFAGPIRPLCD